MPSDPGTSTKAYPAILISPYLFPLTAAPPGLLVFPIKTLDLSIITMMCRVLPNDRMYAYSRDLEMMGYSAVASTAHIKAPPAATAARDADRKPVLHGLDLHSDTVTYERITFQWWPVRAT